MAQNRYGRGSNQYVKKDPNEKFVDPEHLSRLPDSVASPALQTGDVKDAELYDAVSSVRLGEDVPWLPEEFVASIRRQGDSRLAGEEAVESATTGTAARSPIQAAIMRASRRREDMPAALAEVSRLRDEQNIARIQHTGI